MKSKRYRKQEPHLGMSSQHIRQMIQASKCTLCDDIASCFSDESSIKEYQISGICQECQDNLFGP